ncbi:MAG: GNAT family N-acetyltransferase [Bauldia sp.]
MSIAIVDPVVDPGWAALVAERRAGLFHAPAWLGAVRDAYDLPIRAAVLSDAAGRPSAGIAFARLEAPPAPRLLAAPFCDACDPLFTDHAEWSELLSLLESDGIPVHLRCLDAEIPDEQRFTVVKRARWHRIALADTSEARWNALDSSVRRAVAKARRAGLAIQPLEPGAGLVAFHRLHVALRKAKYRLLAQPLAFFEAIARRFQAAGKWHALGASKGDRLVAGTVYLRWGDVLYYKFNASSLTDLDERPNDLLLWEGMELASALGCSHLDLGPSDDDQPGLIRFKRQFGATERELRFLRRDPPGWDERPGIATRQLLGDITDLLTRPEVPDDIAMEAGRRLYRYFA